MKLLTKDSDYAIRALAFLANNKGRFVCARQISKEQGVPYQFLRRILQRLIGHNIVVSREGGGGGFRIKANPEKISIIAVIKIFQGDIRLSDCMFRRKICSNRSICILRKEIMRIERVVEKEFARVTLTRLLKVHK